jgi:pimeloyl-ACP methyl ester carboxylesterase
VLAVNRMLDRARWEAELLAGDGRSVSLLWLDSGHFLHLGHPKRFHRLLSGWLRRVDGDPDAELPGQVVAPCAR